MTKEDKDLLLKDIYARIPYGVEGCCEGETFRTTPLHWYAEYEVGYSIDYMIIKSGWRPYLFPLSSMTEEQNAELMELMYKVDTPFGAIFSENIDYFDWLNKNHFDYRGLIPMGLAEDATDKNIY
jgi:hypothetical protein